MKGKILLAALALGVGVAGVINVEKIQKTARGLRNNNPGNIRENQRVDFDWEGEALNDIDSEFEEFVDPEHGIRAMVRILRSYRRRGVVTVQGIISSWAPAIGDDGEVENDTASYINSVARQTGMSPNDEVLAQNYPALIKAIIKHENGLQPYSDQVIHRGIELGLA